MVTQVYAPARNAEEAEVEWFYEDLQELLELTLKKKKKCPFHYRGLEISPECLLEELMLKLKLQYFGHLMQRADSFEKTLMLGKIEGKRRRGQQRTK